MRHRSSASWRKRIHRVYGLWSPFERNMTVPELQRRLNEIDYPGTMTYEISGFRPVKWLAVRMAALQRLAPDFFKGPGRFLDIGSAKGFFAFKAAQQGATKVVGIEPDLKSVEICQDIHMGTSPHPHTDVRFRNDTFRSFATTEEFDRIFIGNAYHYCYGEIGGWEWIKKLSVLCAPGGEVLVEGPLESCPDLVNAPPNGIWASYPSWVREGLSAGRFVIEMGNCGFRLEADAESPSPGRMIWRFKKTAPALPTRDLKEFGLVQTHKRNYTAPLTVGRKDDLFLKYYANEPPPEFPSQVRIAALSPYATPIEGWLYRGDRCVGWTEEAVFSPFFPYFDHQSPEYAERRVFGLHCRAQQFFLKLGYIDVDPGSINWTLEHERALCCDKNSVWPVAKLGEPDELRKFLQTFRQSYYAMQVYEAELEMAARSLSPDYMSGIYARILERVDTTKPPVPKDQGP